MYIHVHTERMTVDLPAVFGPVSTTILPIEISFRTTLLPKIDASIQYGINPEIMRSCSCVSTVGAIRCGRHLCCSVLQCVAACYSVL